MEVKLGKYKHFKGGEVEVISVAFHSETLEEMVVYKKLYDKVSEETAFKKGSMWVRPKEMFLETIERDGKTMPRFEFIE